ncbi:MAG: N-acetylmuramoyl-L-alanine amidase, partial [Ruminococcaceae bacterium]|nr:N-acetylmuramoyl-L-alanine amidase [Oscillospiraceae bacterium]
GTYYSNYFVNRNTTCPGFLLEMGFVSNPKEYDQLRSEDSLFATANAVADGILNFLQ